MNHLANETSPYLKQRATDPVDWYPWGPEALGRARDEDKPILLSIGYFANHLCHVMAHESFGSAKVAQFMNEHFVNINVDRDERPDLDQIYQNAQQLLNRQPGGWPLTMFLDPNDQLPIFGGTYFPPQQTRRQPSFRDVLNGIAKTYGKQNDKMREFKSKLRDALAPATPASVTGAFDETILQRACGQIDGSFDEKHGGFAEEPKLAHPAGLALMLTALDHVDESAQSERLKHMLDFTLAAMARGGLNDHLAGGFFGRSMDAEWNVPGFEKTLYDNGLLLSLYARRAAASGNAWFRDVASSTADWIVRDMRLPAGAFAASLDGDVEREEGRAYVWSRDEIRAVLGDDYDAIEQHFGLDGKANAGVHWHLRLGAPDPASVTAAPDSNDTIQRAREALLAARAKRADIPRDDKVVTSWNAHAIHGLLDAARALDREDLTDAAHGAIDFLRETHWRDGRLIATSLDSSGSLDAYLDDYAALAVALLESLSTRWRDDDLAFACSLADALIKQFEDTSGGGFFFTAHEHEPLIQRTKPFGDEPFPAGNGLAVLALTELARLTGDARYRDASERALRAGMGAAEAWPSAHATMIRGLLDFTNPAERVALRTAPGADVTPWEDAIAQHRPRARVYVLPADADGIPACPPGAVTARVWRDGDWRETVSEPAALGA